MKQRVPTPSRSFALLFVLLFLCSAVALSFHHHRDGTEHPDCSACVAMQHGDAVKSTHSTPAAHLLVQVAVLSIPGPAAPSCQSFETPPPIRAPPS